jgi:hypothetical protein
MRSTQIQMSSKVQAGPGDAGLFFKLRETHCKQQTTSILPECLGNRGAQSRRHYHDTTKPQKKE